MWLYSTGHPTLPGIITHPRMCIIARGRRPSAIIHIQGWVIIPDRVSGDLWNKAISIVKSQQTIMAFGSNSISQPFKRAIMGHYRTPLSHDYDVIRQYWWLFYWQQPIGSLHFLTQNANNYYLFFSKQKLLLMNFLLCKSYFLIFPIFLKFETKKCSC